MEATVAHHFSFNKEESNSSTDHKPQNSPKPICLNIPSFSSKPNKSTTTTTSTNNNKAQNSHSPNKMREEDQLVLQGSSTGGVSEGEMLKRRNDSSCGGRERLKRHREEVAGSVLIPETWGKEVLLKDWIDYSSFDALLAPTGIASAREALVAQWQRRAITSQRLRIESRC